MLHFLSKYSTEIDVFCFQEVFNGGADEPSEIAENIPEKQYELFSLIAKKLPSHKGYFRPQLGGYYGLATFVHNNTPVIDEGEIYVHREKGYLPEATRLGGHARNLQYITISNKGRSFSILNFHGLWNGGGKTDDPDRIKQSERILAFMKKLEHPYVLIGDFNLEPDTKSLRMLEESGLDNLIKKNRITSTRTSLYLKPIRFADYALIRPEVKVKDFRVLPDEVSDHSPLYLEIE